ncbi:E3 ubiquitin/ISG15 ligase TRIM25-like [Bombina bombina]|uniref:E3 ubiquitin/ISG15 ligase TRIM25-like n=1 Tax=Bombina bombina TaxID=8345 RepID=UPI00235A81BD|nr:E3 ubiquitin/ISG15 ligase TRIM25-like [Bombina bombina]
MASADLREELTCPICFSIYTDPVTLSCGHTYCLSCINRTWDHQDEGEYSCPECKQGFRRRPELKRNLRLRNIAETFQPTESVNDTGIFCTYCTHPAAKSCLLCEASFCDFHLRVHSKSEKHVLTEPTTSWGNRKCYKHKKLLEYYCTEDAACICVFCSLAGEHRGHQVELLNEASEKKKKRLRDVLQKLTTKREKTEKRVQSLQEHRRGVQEKAADVTERLNAQVKDIMKQLEKEKDELTRKMSHIEDLCNMTDPLTVLQEQESHRDDFCGAENGDNEVTQTGDKQVPAGGDLDEGLISLTLYRGIADIVYDVKRWIYLQVPSDILLDINTANNNVIVSGDLKTVSWPRINQQRPTRRERFIETRRLYRGSFDNMTDVKRGIYVQVTSDIILDINTANNNVIVSDDLKTVSWSRINQQRQITPERFTDHPQVLSIRSFSSGRHYWEMQTSKAGHWCVGVCYTSMGRGGDESVIGNNKKSWCLYGGDKDLVVLHDRIYTPLSKPLSYDRVRIYLDYEAGRLTFYELCDPIRHLHTFSTTFTEPLHAAFWIHYDAQGENPALNTLTINATPEWKH